MIISLSIRYFRNEKETGEEMSPAIVSGIVTGDAPFSYWPVFSRFHSNSPRSLLQKLTRSSFFLLSKVAD